jgi:hypothetical protein
MKVMYCSDSLVYSDPETGVRNALRMSVDDGSHGPPEVRVGYGVVDARCRRVYPPTHGLSRF